MPGDDNANIPTSVFTRKESRSQLAFQDADSKSRLDQSAAQPQSARLDSGSIPTSVFTRTESGHQLYSPSGNVDSTSSKFAAQSLSAPISPNNSGSTGDNRLNVMEEGGRNVSLLPGGVLAEKKMDEILSCLEGTLEPSVEGQCYEVDDEDRVVDLWHLRHLALSRGGLMTPALRKRAWPKLVGVDEHILTTTSASLPSILQSSGASITSAVGSEDDHQNDVESTVELTNKDIKIVKQDIGRCVWHVEYHIKMLRKQREKKNGNRANPTDTDTALANFSTFSTTMNHNNQGDSIDSPEIERPEHRSKREMGLILNIITAVLRSVPEGEEKTRLHYFQGLHDVAALFLINLESPSLTSLVMKRLCHLHFRDAMRPNFKKVQIILQAVIMPLLETVDRGLHDYIILGGTDDSSVFALSWILTWFAHDIQNFDVVSRLFDVFLVSHPLFPAYLSVGLLTNPVNRKLIMGTNCEFSALYETICDLPKKMAQNPEETEVMNQFEDCIETSLMYIRDCKPSKLITLAREYRGGYLKEFLTTAPSVFLLEAPPRWAIAPTAPTDWSLIKLAKLMRGQSAEARLARRRCLRLRHFVERINLNSDEHEIGLIAFGLDRGDNSTDRRFRLSKTNGLVGILLLVGTLYGNEYYRGPTSLMKFLPSTSLIKVVSDIMNAHTVLPSDDMPVNDEDDEDNRANTTSQESNDTEHIPVEGLIQVDDGKKDDMASNALVVTDRESASVEIEPEIEDTSEGKVGVILYEGSIDAHIALEDISKRRQEDRKDHAISDQILIEKTTTSVNGVDRESLLKKGKGDINEVGEVEEDPKSLSTTPSLEQVSKGKETIAEPTDIKTTLENKQDTAVADVSPSKKVIDEFPEIISSEETIDNKIALETKPSQAEEDNAHFPAEIIRSIEVDKISKGKETIAEPTDIKTTLDKKQDSVVANDSPSEKVINEVPEIISPEETIDNKIALGTIRPVEADKALLDMKEEAFDDIISRMKDVLNQEDEPVRDNTEESVLGDLSPIDKVAKIFEDEIHKTEQEIKGRKEIDDSVDLLVPILIDNNQAIRKDTTKVSHPSSDTKTDGQTATASSPKNPVGVSLPLPKKEKGNQMQTNDDRYGIVIDRNNGNLTVIDHVRGGVRWIKTVIRRWLLNEKLVYFEH